MSDIIMENYHSIESIDCEAIRHDEVAKILQEDRPVVLKQSRFGPCQDKWNLSYLNDKLHDQNVVIHESDQTELDFLNKNFKYSTCKFSEFVNKLKDSSKNVYYRSTSCNPRAKKPARIEDDLPVLRDDLKPPSFVPSGDSLYYSSVLRIASPSVQIWTHFDLYDNVLCQISGRKRVILISPEDTEHLYVEGDKSPINNFDDRKQCVRDFPSVVHAKLFRVYLEPKDVLYIPALWWHNIRTTSDIDNADHSIGFNIFWRDADILTLYSSGDVYGNKNLKPFDAALTNLDKALGHITQLPGKYKSFYQVLLLARLKKKLSDSSA